MNDVKAPTDHREIWLECRCAAGREKGRTWAQNNTYNLCAGNGACFGPTKYVRADLAEASEIARNEAITQMVSVSRQLGEAEGKLMASELPGVVEGWKAKCSELEARIDRHRKVDREVAQHVETVICMRTRFNGDAPYTGWKGLGLALTEALNDRDSAETALAAERERTALLESLLRRIEVRQPDAEGDVYVTFSHPDGSAGGALLGKPDRIVSTVARWFDDDRHAALEGAAGKLTKASL